MAKTKRERQSRAKRTRRTNKGRVHSLPGFSRTLAPVIPEESNIASTVMRGKNPKVAKLINSGMIQLYNFNQEMAANYFYLAHKEDHREAFPLFGASYAIQMNFNHTAVKKEHMLFSIQCLLAGRRIAKAYKQRPVVKQLLYALYARTIKKGTNPLNPQNLNLEFNAVAENMKRWMERMKKVYAKNKSSPDIGCLYAASIMMQSPWKWWPQDSIYALPSDLAISRMGLYNKKIQRMDNVIEILTKAIDIDPNHRGAHHYLIHAVEESPYPELALESSKTLFRLAGDKGHLLHMPAHIYQRIGLYEESIACNEKAYAADQKFIRQRKKEIADPNALSDSFYVVEYVAHNVHFMVVDSLMLERWDLALEKLKLLEKHVNEYIDPKNNKNMFLEHFLGVRPHALLLAMRFSDVLALPDGDPAYKQVRAETAYCKTVALMKMGRKREAEEQMKSYMEANDTFIRNRPGEACRCGCQKRHGGIVNPHFGQNKYDYIRKNKKSPLVKKTLMGKSEGTSLDQHNSKVVARIKESLTKGYYDWYFGNKKAALQQFKIATDAYENLEYDEPSDYIRPVHETYSTALLLEGDYENAIAVAAKGQIPYPNNPRLIEVNRLAMLEKITREERKRLNKII